MEPQPGLSQSEFEELKDAFDLFDTNGDQEISINELGPILRAIGQNPTEEEVQKVMAKADKDKDQKLSFKEYAELLKAHMKDPQIVEIELREAFRVFDKDRNNTFNFVELRRALTHLGESLTDKEAIELCSLMDANGDNQIDIDEFVKFMCKKL